MIDCDWDAFGCFSYPTVVHVYFVGCFQISPRSTIGSTNCLHISVGYASECYYLYLYGCDPWILIDFHFSSDSCILRSRSSRPPT